MARIVVRNGHLVDPSQNIDSVCDILIEDGFVVKTEKDIRDRVDTVVEARGMYVFPGLVDLHVHLRDPGFTYKEDIFTGCNSASAGGVTTILCMPNTKPPIDNKETIEYIKKLSKSASARVYMCGAITKGLNGEKLADFSMYKELGVVGVSDDGKPVVDDNIMIEALKLAKENKLFVTSHCEDLSEVRGGIINKGSVSEFLDVKGIDRAAENNATRREIELAKQSGCKTHIAHVSTKEAVEMIREAKKDGVKITAETCPHYFSHTEEKLRKRDADYRMNPPLREQTDVEAIIEGIKDGTIDCITTDHAPHSKSDKSNFLTAPNGVVGLETSFAVGYKFLVEAKHITLSKLVDLMSTKPAKLLGVQAGSLKAGMPADFTVFDLNKSWTVLPERLVSKSKNSAFKFENLKGKVKYTYIQGKLVYVQKY